MERESSQRGSAAAEFHDWPDEVLLAELVHTHDERLFSEIVVRHERLVLDVCCRVLHHRQDAEDAAQQTWLVFWRKAGPVFLSSAPLKSWLYGAAAHEARNVLRSRTRWRKKHQGLHDELVRVLQQPEEETEFRQTLELIRTALQYLIAKYRLPIVLCCLEGKSKREVAQELGLPEGTVASRVRQARKVLRRRLEQLGIAPLSNS